MTDGNNVVVPFRCSPRMKAELECAFNGRYTSFSGGVRGILEEWLVRTRTQTPEDAVNRLEADVRLIKEKLGKPSGGGL